MNINDMVNRLTSKHEPRTKRQSILRLRREAHYQASNDELNATLNEQNIEESSDHE